MAKPLPAPRKKLSDEGILEKYLNAVLRFVAQCDTEFAKDKASHLFYTQSNFRGFLRLGPHKREASEIWKICLSAPVVEGKTFRAELIPRKSGDASELEVSIKAEAEWSDAREEAASLLGSKAVSTISEQLEEAYQWLTKKEHLGKSWKTNELRERFKVDPPWDLLKKLHFFNDPRIRVTKDGCWNYEVFVSKTPLPEWSLPPLNPVFPELPEQYSRSHLELLRDFFEDLVLSRLDTDDIFLVFRIGTRREKQFCFPSTQKDSLRAKSYGDALYRMPEIRGVHLFYSFNAELGPWYFGLNLLDGYTWGMVQEGIHRRRSEKPPEEKYGLSDEAAKVFTWLLDQNYEAFERHLSPDVEECLALEIGIDIEKVGEKNLTQLFKLICHEISGKTEFDARVIPWAEGYHEPKLHLYFREKRDLEEIALASVQHFLRTQGVEPAREKISQALQSIMQSAGD